MGQPGRRRQWCPAQAGLSFWAHTGWEPFYVNHQGVRSAREPIYALFGQIGGHGGRGVLCAKDI